MPTQQADSLRTAGPVMLQGGTKMVNKCAVCGTWTYSAWYSREDTYPNGRLLETRRDADDLSAFCSEEHRDQHDAQIGATR